MAKKKVYVSNAEEFVKVVNEDCDDNTEIVITNDIDLTGYIFE